MSILEKEAILTEKLKKVYLGISSFSVKRNYFSPITRQQCLFKYNLIKQVSAMDYLPEGNKAH